jgi:hypothetical protein
MNLEGWEPFDRKACAKEHDVNDVIEEAEDQSFNDPFEFGLLSLCAYGTRNTRTNESRQKN